MAKVRCIYTCYMPSDEAGVKWERYEDLFPVQDEQATSIYTIPGHRVAEFVATGWFERVHLGDEEDENDDD